MPLPAGRALTAVLVAGAAAVPAAETPAPPNPGPRIAHALALHPPSMAVVMFGGQHPDGTPLADTWGFDGKAWKRLAVDGPPARRWPALAFDPVRQRLVLFGGRDGVGRAGTSRDDCWEWDGRAWSKAPGGPAGRDHFTLTWDEKRRELVLFGGWDGKAVRGDTWRRGESGAWREAQVPGPAPRAAHGAAFDAAGQRLVLYGGRALDVFFDDTWLWDGQAWSRAEAAGPGRRSFQGMAWDAAGGRVVLAGGREGDDRFGDAWAWGAGRWQALTARGPTPRLVYALAPGPAGGLVLYGGGHQDEAQKAWILDDQTWILEGEAWRRVP
jgi:hypothetical protein